MREIRTSGSVGGSTGPFGDRWPYPDRRHPTSNDTQPSTTSRSRTHRMSDRWRLCDRTVRNRSELLVRGRTGRLVSANVEQGVKSGRGGW
jgi:hypothetical protein